MIDHFSIVLFGILSVYVAYKAVVLDKTIPWFKNPDSNQRKDNADKNTEDQV